MKATRTLTRLLNLVTRVEQGETGTAILLTIDIFILLTVYYIIKPVREGLILALPSGAEYKSYSSAAIALILIITVPLYGRATRRFARNRLISFITLFFCAHLVGFWALAAIPGSRAWLGIPFYLWVGIFSMMVVAQFWAFANDLYSLEQGKRLFPLIGVGGSIGAATGSFLEAHVVGLLGLDNLLLLAAALLATTAGLVELIHRRSLRRSSSGPNPEPPGPAARRETNGLKMVANRRYLRIMALFTIVFTFANTNGEYILSVLISDAAAGAAARGELGGLSPEAYISQRYGQFYFVVNALGILLQALVVSRVVRAGGIRLALLLTPVIALGVWSAASILPVLGVVWLGKALENSTDYSINNTARQMLWLPLPSHVKYNAKQAIDALFVRLGDVASALLVFVAVGLLAASIRSMAIVNASLVVAWLATAGLLVRHYRRMLTKDVATKIERGRFDSLSHAVSEP